MKKSVKILSGMLMAVLVTSIAQAQEKNLAVNPGGEEAYSLGEHKKLVKYCWFKNKSGQLPKGWGVYNGGGTWDYGISTEEKKNGKNSVYVEIIQPKHDATKNVDWASMAIHFGGECDGYSACNSMKVKPGENYRFSFWVKGTLPKVNAIATGFLPADSSKKDKRVLCPVTMYNDKDQKIKAIILTAEWKRYEAEVTVPADCVQMTFGVGNISGYTTGKSDKAGANMFIDDVEIIKEED